MAKGESADNATVLVASNLTPSQADKLESAIKREFKKIKASTPPGKKKPRATIASGKNSDVSALLSGGTTTPKKLIRKK